MSELLVSVVTPFYNTAPYLAECIESVLAQSYPHFEYVLSDNCSTDGSADIVEAYARCDSRIRLIRQTRLLSQVQHYNSALGAISGSSQFCKVVQADDTIFPDCLNLMVRAFEQSDSIGLVSAYDLKRNVVRGSGFPYPTSILPGRELARLYLRNGLFVFGSPTTVMYRSALIRDSQVFYDESRLHEDTEKCMQILEHWDFGFVPQVLSFLRTDNESISGAVRSFQPDLLDRYIIVKRYASAFLETDEAVRLKRKARQDYYRVIAREALNFRGAAFWKYHRHGLETIGERLDLSGLFLHICWVLLWMVLNPGATIRAVARRAKQT